LVFREPPPFFSPGVLQTFHVGSRIFWFFSVGHLMSFHLDLSLLIPPLENFFSSIFRILASSFGAFSYFNLPQIAFDIPLGESFLKGSARMNFSPAHPPFNIDPFRFEWWCRPLSSLPLNFPKFFLRKLTTPFPVDFHLVFVNTPFPPLHVPSVLNVPQRAYDPLFFYLVESFSPPPFFLLRF